ncbi:MAG: hypothetical protein JWO53_709 [Chlamydiia bacterium]|nr:hypothetical protein [Chlamydiia bacterium]
MLKRIVTLLSFAAIFLQSGILSADTTDAPLKVELEATQGYRVDKIVYNFSGPHKQPNILSELTFKDIKIYQSRLITKLILDEYFARIELGYGNICSGRVQDSDYASNNRKNEFSRSYNRISKGYTADAVIKIGKNFQVNDWTLSPLAGYSLNVQKFQIGNGTQTIGVSKNNHIKKTNHRMHGVRCKDRVQWNAPLVGLRAERSFNKVKIDAEYDFLFCVQYDAKSYWNLRNQHFKDKSNRSKGFGHVATIGAGYEIAKNLELRTEYQFSYLQAKGGKHTSHGHSSPFRKAAWTSNELRLGLNYAF